MDLLMAHCGRQPFDDESAWAVREALLTKTRLAMEAGDFSAFEPCFLLPHRLETYLGTKVFHTRADLFALFQSIRVYYSALNAKRVERVCIDASFNDRETIQSTHMTYLLDGTNLLRQSYPTFSVIRRAEGVWRIDTCISAVQPDKLHERALSTIELDRQEP